SKCLQRRELGIRDVGRQIMSLSLRLMSNYPEASLLPVECIGDGTADDVMLELFGDDMTCLLELEAKLQPPETPMEVLVRSDIETGRSTRKRDVSSSYATLMSKKAREER